ncbi:hypothetical protein VUR80DRAFT_3056 [Thermomyces stellatus]
MAFTKTQAPAGLKARLKTSYDAIAEMYNKWTEDHHAVRLKYLGEFKSRLRTTPPVRILELGCGAGVPATRVLAGIPGAEVVANDLSTRQIALARENAEAWAGGRSVRFVEGDMMDPSVLDFPAGSLDGVVAFYSLIHLPRDEQSEMLARIARWLRPGGVLLANFSADETEGVIMEAWLHEQGWMFWSGWGEGTVGRVEGEGMRVLVKELEGEGVDVEFLWVVAEKKGGE